MVFTVYMRRRCKHDIAPPAKKQRFPCPEKIHLRVKSPASPKKMIFILENTAFLLKHHMLIDTPERAQEVATGDDLQEKVILQTSEGSQEKTRASFLIKLQAYGRQLY